MFAFALWDRAERRLHLVRDRFGEKPLYYGVAGGTLLFGSELKALARHPAWQGTLDLAALGAYLRRGYVPAPASIYRGVHKVRPGCIVSFDAALSPVESVYWSVEEVARAGLADPLDLPDAGLVDALDARLRASVRDTLVADVPVGAFLSGGIDSSLVVAAMQAESAQPVRTFTIGFDDSAYDESFAARAVARHLGTRHTELILTPAECREVIPDLPAIYDEPFADSSQIPTALVARLAAGEVTVALSGDGGDEIFGGYNRHRWIPSLWRRQARIPRPLRRLASATIQSLTPARWDRLYAASAAMLPARYRMRLPGEKLHKLARVVDAAGPFEVYDRLTASWLEAPQLGGGLAAHGDGVGAGLGDLTAELMVRDAQEYLPDDILVKVDRACMAVSLESRAPFLDHRVAELAWRIPTGAKVRDGRGKWVLRELLHRYVPQALVDRPKMGFGVPIGAWLRGPLRTWAGDLLSPTRLHAQGLLDAAAVDRAWREHQSGQRDRTNELWTVLMLQAWLDAETASPRVSPRPRPAGAGR
jgi:asparagine synthase (glutamine-hydrolysing)